MKKAILVWIIFLFFPTICQAENTVDENAMFSDAETVVENIDTTKTALSTATKSSTLGLSGEISNTSLLTLEDDYASGSKREYQNVALLSLLVDARFQKSYKIFANIETQHVWEVNNPRAYLRECFVDTPINNKIYLRWGRQVLKWGRCYLWNPTDLINVENKTFIEKVGSRNGVYGVKIHIPKGTRYNFYGFLDTGKDFDTQKMAGAVKFEFLLGSTEMAFSYWNKKNYLPVYGYDFSSRAFNVDINGEISISHGYIYNRLREDGGILSVDRNSDKWIPRASIDLGKSFHFNNQADKINLTGEMFYNAAGYSKNIFQDQSTYLYREPMNISGVAYTEGDKKTFLLGNNLYEANFYGKYYAALFTTVNNFLTSDYTLTSNWIENLNDKSSIISLGVKYQNIKDWYVDVVAYSFLGHKDSEYTFLNQTYSFQLAIGYRF